MLTFKFSGTIGGNFSSLFVEEKYVTLIVLELSRKTVNDYLNSAQEIINQMNSSGLVTSGVNSLLDTMKQEYSSLSFNDLEKNYKQIQTILNSAKDSKKLISEVNSSITAAAKNGIVVSETKKILYLAQILYDRGDYVSALAKLKEAQVTFALETKGEFNLAYTIKNNPLESFGILLGLIVVTSGSSLLIRFRFLKRKL